MRNATSFDAPPRRAPRRLRRGFTLVEIAVVVVILGIVAAVAAPRWAGYLSKCRADAAAQRIAQDVARTRSLAYSSSSAVTLTFTVAQHKYQVSGFNDPDHPSRPYIVDLTIEPYKSTLVSANFGGIAEIAFSGYGQPSSGGSVVVACGGESRTVTVEAITGKCTIQ